MNCSITYNSNNKKISVSADTYCNWSCVVTNGNITLSQNYGVLNASNSYTISGITIYTYNTNDMYGNITCCFQNNNGCMIKRHLSIQPSPLHVFYVDQKELLLFGEDTKAYIYVYYGTLYKDDNDVLSTLSIEIDKERLFYDGNNNDYIISANDITLYKIKLGEYNEDEKYFRITITSLTNHIFNDTIIIKGYDNKGIEDKLENGTGQTQNFIINLSQTIVENAPTLLKISPSFVFLDSDNPKQKISVTSLFKGIPVNYGITSTTAITEPALITTNDIEEYLNSSPITPFRVDDLDIRPFVTQKNASHFILDMSDADEDVDNVGNATTEENRAYELYVVQEGNTSCFQKLEIFFDYKFNPENYIRIVEIDGIYGYIKEENDTLSFATATTISSGEIQSPITLYFTKDIETSPSITGAGYVYVQYEMKKNVKFTIESVPNRWQIHTLSEHVKEVKQDNNLLISLETTIPSSESSFVKLINENGKTCTIFFKTDENLFSSFDTMFYFVDDNNMNNTSISSTINANLLKICDIKSVTTDEKWYYFNEEFTASTNSQTISLNAIKYTKNVEGNIVNETLVAYEFPILYNSDIKKYYINYGSITQKYNKEIEVKDTNKYYFTGENDNLKITIPIPLKTRFVPWTVSNNGCGVKYDVYTLFPNDNKFTKLNQNSFLYKPLTEKVGLYCIKELPNTLNDEIKNACTNAILLVPIIVVDELTITSGIIFQQMNSLKELTCFIDLNMNSNNRQYINKYGTTSSINSMSGFSATNKADAFFEENPIEINVINNNVEKLFYASYEKISSFNIIEQDVDFKIAEIGVASLKKEWVGSVLNPNNATLRYKSSTYTIMLTQSLWNESKEWEEITDWEIQDGFLKIKNSSTDEYEYIFPQSTIFNARDGNENVGLLFVENYDLNENSTFRYYSVEYKQMQILNINGNTYEITDEQTSIEYDCLYEVLEKTVEFGSDNDIYVIDKQNILEYRDENNNIIKCIAFQEKDKWYVNLPSVTFPISWSNGEKRHYIQYKGSSSPRTYLTNDMGLYIDGFKFTPNIKVNLSGLTLNILTNIDGENEKFIIINDKKYVANNNKISLKYNYEIEIQNANTQHQYIQIDRDFLIDVYYEPSYEYVKINDEIYKLTEDGYVIYDGEKYYKIKQKTGTVIEYFIVINNNGYIVKKTDEAKQYYIILNYIKYYYYPNNYGSVTNVYNFTSKRGDCFVDEIANESFHFNLNFDDLLSNDIITGTYGNYVITNNYATILSDTYFTDKTLPIKKDIWLNKTSYPYNVAYDEIVTPILRNNLNISSIEFHDDTVIILENGEELRFRDGNTYVINEDKIFTINDYSEISFNGNCFITVKNNCEIEFVINGDAENQSLSIRENETIFIGANNTLIFKDVTKVKIHKTAPYLYVFNEVVYYNNELYIASLLDDKKIIIIDNEKFYIYDGKVNINGIYINCYEKAIGYKIFNNNSISTKVYEVKKVLDSKNEPKYFYFGEPESINGECENANKPHGAGITNLSKTMLNGDSISIICVNKNNAQYASPTNGSTVYLWFEEDELLDNTNKTYTFVSDNFGINNPINNFIIPNGEFILITPPSSTSGRRYYVENDTVTYNGVVYKVSGDSQNRYVKIGETKYGITTSNAVCNGIKIFLNNNSDVKIAFNYTVNGKTIINDFNNDNISYYATTPYFSPCQNEWNVEQNLLSGITIYDKNIFKYSKAILTNHSNLGNIIIENNILSYNVDCYKITCDDFTYNGNRQGGCSYTTFYKQYGFEEKIILKVVPTDNDEYVSPLDGCMLLLWFMDNPTTYTYVSRNFGVNNPLNYNFTNRPFIVIERQRFYVNNNKVVVGGNEYQVVNNKVTISGDIYDVMTSNAKCFAFKVFLPNNVDKKIKVNYICYTSKQEEYKVGTFSIWNYLTNSYAKAFIGYEGESKNLITNRNLSLYNIQYEVDQNKYVQVDNTLLPIYSLIETDVTTLSYNTNNEATKTLNFLSNNTTLSNQTITFKRINKEGVIINNDLYYIQKDQTGQKYISYKDNTMYVVNNQISFESIYIDDKYEILVKHDDPNFEQSENNDKFNGYVKWADNKFPVHKGGHVYILYAKIDGIKYYVENWETPSISWSGNTYIISGQTEDNIYYNPFINRQYVTINNNKVYLNVTNNTITYNKKTYSAQTITFKALTSTGQYDNLNADTVETLILYNTYITMADNTRYNIHNDKVYNVNNTEVGEVLEYGFKYGVISLNRYCVRIKINDEEDPTFYTLLGDRLSINDEKILLDIKEYYVQSYGGNIQTLDEYLYTMTPYYQISIDGNQLSPTTVELDSTLLYSLNKLSPYDKNDTTSLYGIVYNKNLCQINNNLLTIRKECEIQQKYRTDGTLYYLVFFDINAYLTFNFYFNKSNEKQGNVHHFTVQNALSLDHTEYIMIQSYTKNNANVNVPVYGYYKLIFDES